MRLLCLLAVRPAPSHAAMFTQHHPNTTAEEEHAIIQETQCCVLFMTCSDSKSHACSSSSSIFLEERTLGEKRSAFSECLSDLAHTAVHQCDVSTLKRTCAGVCVSQPACSFTSGLMILKAQQKSVHPGLSRWV